MKTTTKLFAVAVYASLCAFSVHADEADGSQLPHAATAGRSVAEVRAEARTPVKITNGSTGFHGVTQSAQTPATVRSEARVAARGGMTTRGEL